MLYPVCVPCGVVRENAAHKERTREDSAAFHRCGSRNVPREVKVISTELLKIKPHLTSSGNLLPLGERTLHQHKKETISFTILFRVLAHQSWWHIHVWKNGWIRRGRTELLWWVHLNHLMETWEAKFRDTEVRGQEGGAIIFLLWGHTHVLFCRHCSEKILIFFLAISVLLKVLLLDASWPERVIQSYLNGNSTFLPEQGISVCLQHIPCVTLLWVQGQLQNYSESYFQGYWIVQVSSSFKWSCTFSSCLKMRTCLLFCLVCTLQFKIKVPGASWLCSC